MHKVNLWGAAVSLSAVAGTVVAAELHASIAVLGGVQLAASLATLAPFAGRRAERCGRTRSTCEGRAGR